MAQKIKGGICEILTIGKTLYQEDVKITFELILVGKWGKRNVTNLYRYRIGFGVL